MATEREDEYESEPEGALLPSVMRRREASDDEEEDEVKVNRRIDTDSGVESEGQGGAPAYDDEEDREDGPDEEGLEDYEDYVEEEEYEERMSGNRDVDPRVETRHEVVESGRDLAESSEFTEQSGETQEGEKKENEPFSVPTAGAFYMHDDRFRENGRGRHRRTFGGKRLWESKDEKAWVHDRFEEMKLQDVRRNEEKRNSRGRFRGRDKRRGPDRGYNQSVVGDHTNSLMPYDHGNNQKRPTTKNFTGRGPRRYEAAVKNSSFPPKRSNHSSRNSGLSSNSKKLPAKHNEIPTTQRQQSGKPHNMSSNDNSVKERQSNFTMQTESSIPRKNVFASNLNSASPPFYPSGSTSQEPIEKREVPSGMRNMSYIPTEDRYSSAQPTALQRGKNVVEADNKNKFFMEDSTLLATGKQSFNIQAGSGQTSQGRGFSQHGQMIYQKSLPSYQGNRSSTPTKQIHTPTHVASQVLNQQLGSNSGGGTLSSSPPRPSSTNSSDGGEIESLQGSSKPKSSSSGRGKNSMQGGGRGSFMYAGAQVVGATGAMGVAHGDQNFPPTIMPVMQFGGQHHGGLGVPAVGVALPGYVAQSQLGFGNSEMTWVPVLAGAAGPLGATYCPPYLAVDGSYYSLPSGQASSPSSSNKETNTNKPSTSWKAPQQKSETTNDDHGQRQNKPRRYSEMNFGQ